MLFLGWIALFIQLLEQAIGTRPLFDYIMERTHIRIKIYPGFGFMNIYRNITYILYLFLFVRVEVSANSVALRARPCPKTSPTNYWAIGRWQPYLHSDWLALTFQWELFVCGITLDGWKNQKGALFRGPTQSDNRQIYFNLKIMYIL